MPCFPTDHTDITEEKTDQVLDCDVFVYGSTPGGCAAAIEAARRGCKVILACPQQHPGGMMASGLSTTDAVRREMFGGLVIEFINGVRKEYRRTIGENSDDWKRIQDGWFYEPSVAERVFEQLLAAESDALAFLQGHHFAMSSTHVAMSVLRMEPLWMTTGQIAGLAAMQAMDSGIDVANLDPEPLQRMLNIQVNPYE